MADNRTYNARVTTEALEKKFRDTFPSQAGAELVDDLYASGVIVPIVDFTAAAEGSGLRSDLQRAWDFATGYTATTVAGTVDLITTPGFWKVDLNVRLYNANATARIFIDDGAAVKNVFVVQGVALADNEYVVSNEFEVFLRSGDTLKARTDNANNRMDIWYRQIADVSGNLVNPLGFTSS